MTNDTLIGVVGLLLGLVGTTATIWAAFDARRQRYVTWTSQDDPALAPIKYVGKGT